MTDILDDQSKTEVVVKEAVVQPGEYVKHISAFGKFVFNSYLDKPVKITIETLGE